MRWRDLTSLFKVTVLLSLHCEPVNPARVRSAMSRFFILPDLQKKVKVDEDVIQASESEKHFLEPLLGPFLQFQLIL